MNTNDSGYGHKLYGRRKGPKLSAHKETLRRTLLPQLALKLSPGADPRSYFAPPPCGEVGEPSEARRSGWGAVPDASDSPPPEALRASPPPQGGGDFPVDDVWLEIGFGAGEHLIEQARANPRVGLIGAEPYEAGVAKLLSKIQDGFSSPVLSAKAQSALVDHGGGGRRCAEGAEPDGGGINIRLHEGDARDIIAALPDAALGRVFILFPDPWPKTRHHKRRFIQTEMLNALARVMKPGAELRVASDDAGYVEWTLERVLPHPAFCWTARCAADWQKRPSGWPQTRYEAKALHGPPAYLCFVRA